MSNKKTIECRNKPYIEVSLKELLENVEIPRAIEQGKRVILIIIKPCDWTGSTLGKFNAHNKGGVIGLTEDYKNGQVVPREYTEIERDAMWVGVVKAIRGLIERDK